MMPVRILSMDSRRAIGLVSKRDVMWCFLGRGTIRIFFHWSGILPVAMHAFSRARVASRACLSICCIMPILSLDRPADTLSDRLLMYVVSSSRDISAPISWNIFGGFGKACASHLRLGGRLIVLKCGRDSCVVLSLDGMSVSDLNHLV